MPNYRDDPDYRDLRETAGERVCVAPHIGAPHGVPLLIMPGHAMTLGRTTLGQGKVQHPTVTIFALGSATALVFIPTADELEAMAETMAKEAARMREAADATAADLIDRARRGRGD